MDSGEGSRRAPVGAVPGLGSGTADAGKSADTAEQKATATSAPAITLPKGGGAIRSLGEKFAANPVTGTGSMTVPIATSPGRSGFGPQLSLSYDSGSGNGPFGFGWGLSLPAITRKTDKGLPRYDDAEESDVFILSGAEDLVPVLNPNGSRFEDGTTDPDFTIHRYRPRIEGLFARIERWTNRKTGDVHWRSISKDNVLTLYGKDAESRIADPLDTGRIFSWLICETRDDKGNALLYQYKREDGKGVDVTQPCERNRGALDDPRRTANRYLKTIRYGNRTPVLDETGHRPRFLSEAQAQSAGWMFEVVFDYGEHNENAPTPSDENDWSFRADPFSSCRPGFEVRTTRLCQRVLMFHHIPDLETGEKGYEGLVRSTDFDYSYEQDPVSSRTPVYSFLCAVTQNGYRRDGDGYLKRGLPPVEFEYTQPVVQDRVEEVDLANLENLPTGVDGSAYQWTDLHGEGIPGILTEQAGAWYYKRNLSPIADQAVELAPLERVALEPNLTLASGAQFMDLAGDGQPDLVVLEGPTPGLYEHDEAEGWQSFRPFTSRLNRDTRDPNLRLVDLDGDGRADVLITEDDALVWHASLAEAGFGPARRVAQALDEEKGPRVVFADGTQSIYLADLSGDGLTDIVRIRNGEVCYWPNLGYCRFGAKVTMDNAPWFDNPDQFDHKRIRLADIDGSGTTDIIYLHRDGVRLYFNQSGNGWGQPETLKVFPRVDDLVSIMPTDLLGNGTACLVWSSPLPGDARQPMRYVNLMGNRKPHLLIKTTNNLGAGTHVDYAPSTKFYLQDKRDGKPWVTRLPFPVHVVERVETHDLISRNRFVTRYAYHHGYFDGEEREFRGFAMVEQWDTEEIGAIGSLGIAENAANGAPESHGPRYAIGQVASCSIQGVWQSTFRPIVAIKPSIYTDGGWFYFFEGAKTGVHEDDVLLPEEAGDRASGSLWDGTRGEDIAVGSTSNIDESSYVPPVHTKTWFHTGVYLGRDHVSDYFAGLLDARDIGEYYREPGLSDTQARALLLEDTILPDGLTVEEEREACRALKGSMLRQEVYALDATDKAPHPYSVTEQSFTIRALQPRGSNRHAVFFTHAREAISYHYERNPADPRIEHALTLEVDDYGNVLKQVAIGYGRRSQIRVVDAQGNMQLVPNPGLTELHAADQAKQTTQLLTYTENRVTIAIESPDTHRNPLPCEAITFELTGYTATGSAGRYQASDFVEPDTAAPSCFRHKFTAPEIAYESTATGDERRRPIEWLRTLYRRDDLGGLLPLGDLDPLALPGESYKLAFTPGLLAQVFQRPQQGQASEPLLPDPAAVLGGQEGNRGGYLQSQSLKEDGRFPASDADDHWWLPSGRSFYSSSEASPQTDES